MTWHTCTRCVARDLSQGILPHLNDFVDIMNLSLTNGHVNGQTLQCTTKLVLLLDKKTKSCNIIVNSDRLSFSSSRSSTNNVAFSW